MTRTRTILAVFALLIGFAVLAPARAQIMPSQGIDIPWFTSKAEKAQRDACRRNLPECRASVRAQMAVEESITVILPWASLGIAILAVLFWLRAQEKKRERKKKLARLNHTSAAHKKMDQERHDRRESDDAEADRSAF